jgi:L-fuculose-phosphate aldolase
MWEEKLITGSGGQISARLPGTDLIMIKPSGFSLGHLKADDMVIINEHGRRIEGDYKPSSEVPFHTALYRARSDIGAVVHTQSRFATALGIANKELLPIWCEALTLARGVLIAPYRTGGSEELAKVVVETMGDKYAIILQNHGTVSVGPTLEDAFQTSKDVEWLAQIQFIATMSGEPKLLPESDRQHIVEAFRGHPMCELRRNYGNPES